MRTLYVLFAIALSSLSFVPQPVTAQAEVDLSKLTNSDIVSVARPTVCVVNEWNCSGGSICGVNYYNCTGGICGVNYDQCTGGVCGLNLNDCGGGICLYNSGYCNGGICIYNEGTCKPGGICVYNSGTCGGGWTGTITGTKGGRETCSSGTAVSFQPVAASSWTYAQVLTSPDGCGFGQTRSYDDSTATLFASEDSLTIIRHTQTAQGPTTERTTLTYVAGGVWFDQEVVSGWNKVPTWTASGFLSAASPA